MKTSKIPSVGTALVLCGLVASAFAGSAFIEVYPWDSPPWENGTVYSVPAGAYYEWFVQGEAHLAVNGGGLSVSEYGYSYPYDVGATAYADDISYQMSAFGSSGYAMLYVGW